jgi:uncharacterized protein YlaN (UPF0358 family)
LVIQALPVMGSAFLLPANLCINLISSNIICKETTIFSRGGSISMSESFLIELSRKASQLLTEDAEKIRQLIAVQMENLATRKCPLYEEVLDTQMYGLSREVDFAVRAGLVKEAEGKEILVELERNLAQLYSAMELN